MATTPELVTLDFNATEIDEIQGALDTISPEVRDKFIGALTVLDAVTTHIELDDWTKDKNRPLLASRRFLAQADRRGYIHSDDRYNPLREKVVGAFTSRFGSEAEEPQEAPNPQSILFSVSALLSSLSRR